MFNYPFQAYEKRELKDFVCSDKIELNLLKYSISGVVLINTWTDAKGSYEMKSFDIEADSVSSNEEFAEKIRQNLNDGGFGAKEILGAYVIITACYDHPIMVGISEFEVGEEFISCQPYELTPEDKDFLLETISTF